MPLESNISYRPMPTCPGGDQFGEISNIDRGSRKLDISLLLEPPTLSAAPMHCDVTEHSRGPSPDSVMQFPQFLIKKNVSPAENAESEKRVTIWNWKEKRKLSGNSAPFKRNLQRYLKKHPDWQEYNGQDANGNRPNKKRRNQAFPAKAAPIPAPAKAASIPEPVKSAAILEPIIDALVPEDVVETCELNVRRVEQLTKLRTQQLAAKRKLFQMEEAAHRAAAQKLQEMEKRRPEELLSKQQQQRADDWKRAQVLTERIRTERAVAKQHEREKLLMKDEQQQQAAVFQSVNRVALWKRARLARGSCPIRSMTSSQPKFIKIK